MLRVYFDDKKIEFQFADGKVGNNLSDVKLPDNISLKITNFLDNSEGLDLILPIDNANKLPLSDFFEIIEAAGGLVFDEKGDMLFIFRRGKWDLPKGKIEKGESPEIAAIREVKEECGLEKVELKNLICCTYHIYPLKGRFVLKKTHWFKMIASEDQKLLPQKEEDITEALWLNSAKMQIVIKNTFPSIKDVLSACDFVY